MGYLICLFNLKLTYILRKTSKKFTKVHIFKHFRIVNQNYINKSLQGAFLTLDLIVAARWFGSEEEW